MPLHSHNIDGDPTMEMSHFDEKKEDSPQFLTMWAARALPNEGYLVLRPKRASLHSGFPSMMNHDIDIHASDIPEFLDLLIDTIMRSPTVSRIQIHAILCAALEKVRA